MRTKLKGASPLLATSLCRCSLSWSVRPLTSLSLILCILRIIATLVIGGALIVAAVLGKFLAGYAPFWIRANKRVIGVGMIPRGEVGLIFAQMGLTSGVFDAAMFSAVTLMVMVTTFMAPPLLKLWFPPAPRPRSEKEPEAIEDLVMEP